MFFQRLGAFFLDIIEVIVFAIAIFLFIYLLVMQPHRIKGSSMEPNFHDGEYLLSDKITYRLREPGRGDVIVFEAPGANGDEFIKRIIGVPGDKITLKSGSVYVNNQLLNEDYIPQDVSTNPGAFLREGTEVTVPEDYYFVLGDNRSFSSDSRAWGFVTKTKITGKAWFIYWPPEQFGTIHSAEY
jgi:signal peptidase I